jgi:hypothetical protein
MKDKDAQLMMEALQRADKKDVVQEADASDYVPPRDEDKLKRAKERGYDKEPSDIDHHTQYKMDRDLLNPLHAAAQEAGAKDLNDWMIQQIKDQGEEWIQNFIQDVISPGME